MTIEKEEEHHKKMEQFSAEFRDLVRKYCPTYEALLAAQLQDRTSVFSPYIWVDRRET